MLKTRKNIKRNKLLFQKILQKAFAIGICLPLTLIEVASAEIPKSMFATHNDLQNSWLEQSVDPGNTLTYAIVLKSNADTSTDNSSPLETTVKINDVTQRIRVYDINYILPKNVELIAEAATVTDSLEDSSEFGRLISYNLSLVDEYGRTLSMPLSNNVKLMFEVVEGLDDEDLQIVLVNQMGDDIEFEEVIDNDAHCRFVSVLTANFSRSDTQADTMSGSNKVALNQTVYITIAFLLMIVVVALVLAFKLNSDKNKILNNK